MAKILLFQMNLFRLFIRIILVILKGLGLKVGRSKATLLYQVYHEVKEGSKKQQCMGRRQQPTLRRDSVNMGADGPIAPVNFDNLSYK